jgi:hypothetical protein
MGIQKQKEQYPSHESKQRTLSEFISHSELMVNNQNTSHIDWMIYLKKVHRSNRTVVFRISYNQYCRCDVYQYGYEIQRQK